MKKIRVVFVALLLTFGLASLYTAPVAANDTIVVIHGRVLTAEGKPVSGVKVQISCKGVVIATSAATDVNGNYSVSFSSDKCPPGEKIRITVVQGNAKILILETTALPLQNIDLVLKDTVNIPEYGWLGGIIAGSAAIGAIVYIRRRQVSDAL